MKQRTQTAWSIDRQRFLDAIGVTSAELDELVHRLIPGVADVATGLTPREMEVFERIGKAHRSRTIAEELGISLKTLDIHRANICRKLKCRANGVVRAWAAYQVAVLAGVAPSPVAAAS